MPGWHDNSPQKMIINDVGYTISQCAVVLLAAGSSSRLGRPKQLLPFRGKSLLQHAVDAALESGMRPLLVVTGAYTDIISRELQNQEVTIVNNPGWEEGMAASIRTGITAAMQMGNIDAVLLMVCDQPFITPALLQTLLQVQRNTGAPAVASKYGDRKGTPVLWHKIFFPQLLQLQGDTGAKKIIQQYDALIPSVAFEKGLVDVDTLEAYERLQQGNNE
jgi:molybdenum cofactor cytidylyltransferase